MSKRIECDAILANVRWLQGRNRKLMPIGCVVLERPHSVIADEDPIGNQITGSTAIWSNRPCLSEFLLKKTIFHLHCINCTEIVFMAPFVELGCFVLVYLPIPCFSRFYCLRQHKCRDKLHQNNNHSFPNKKHRLPVTRRLVDISKHTVAHISVQELSPCRTWVRQVSPFDVCKT